MNEEIQERLHKLLGGFITEEGLNPSLVEIHSSPTKVLIVITINPAAPPNKEGAENG